MLRLALFCDSNSSISAQLAQAAVRAAAPRAGLRIVAICDATRGPVRGGFERAGTELIKSLVKGAFDPRHATLPDRGERISLAGVARRARVPLLRPARGDVNASNFVDTLVGEQAANGVLALGCVAILRPALLAALPCAVNYHNSLLPRYAGLRATRWSLYHREPVCGFTFHRMTARIDAGDVLIQARLDVSAGSGRHALEARKTREACSRLPELFDRLLSQDPGTPQTGPGSYFGVAEWKAICTIEDPAALDCAELLHRLRCFDVLRIRIGTDIYEATLIRRTTHAGPRSFRTRDGVLLEVGRINYLPWPLARMRAGHL
jgi:folate-dependent phosphoribosylglycinamide formyltransferase PurN